MQNTNNLCMGCMKDNGGTSVCPVCGTARDAVQNAPLLPLRTWLEDRYLIGRAMDQNGEGVTYLGWDNVMQAPVRIREFLPLRLVSRAPGTQFITVEHGCESVYNEYLSDFLAMARGLARMRELSAVFSVYDIFESNGTAYYISEHIESISLERFLAKNGGSLTWDQAKTVMIPVLSTVQSLHEANIVHGGISPRTVQVCRDGKFRLNGFCIAAARSSRSELDAELFAGYAAVEQYGAEGRFGPVTDVYGYAATIFRVLSGTQPPVATDRVADDRMILPARAAQSVPEQVLQALVGALQIMPSDRVSSAGRLRSALSGSPDVTRMQNGGAVGGRVVPPVSRGTPSRIRDEEIEPHKKKKNNNLTYALFALVITVALALIVLVLFWGKLGLGGNSNTSSSPDSSAAPSVAVSSTSSKTVIPKDWVPDIEKLNYADVLTEYGDSYEIVIEKAVYSNDFSKGTILSQSPAKNTEITNNDLEEDGRFKITVTVSLGSQYTTMPNLTGKSKDEVILTLLKAGFDYNNIKFDERYSTTIEYQHVVDTEPAADSKNVDRNSKITVYLQSVDLSGGSSSSNP